VAVKYSDFTYKQAIEKLEEEEGYVKVWKRGKNTYFEGENKKTAKSNPNVVFLSVKAPEAPASAPAPEKKAEEPKKTTFPLVSREQYKLHVKLLSAVFAGKKAMVKDRTLQAELADVFFNTGSMGGMKTHSQAFINGIVEIYNDTTKRKSRYSNPPTKLEWMDWFDSSKTGQTNGIDFTKSDNYRYGGLEKYFNIYPDATGKAREFHDKEYGYFFGFSAEAPAPASASVSMPKKELVEEHKKLVQVLKKDEPKEVAKEAKKQEAELKTYTNTGFVAKPGHSEELKKSMAEHAERTAKKAEADAKKSIEFLTNDEIKNLIHQHLKKHGKSTALSGRNKAQLIEIYKQVKAKYA
jgi:hypothetical protein